MYLVLIYHWCLESAAAVNSGQRVEAVIPLAHLSDAWDFIKATRPHLFESDPVLPHLRRERVLDEEAFMESVQRAKRELEGGRERFHVAYAYSPKDFSSREGKCYPWYLWFLSKLPVDQRDY